MMVDDINKRLIHKYLLSYQYHSIAVVVAVVVAAVVVVVVVVVVGVTRPPLSPFPFPPFPLSLSQAAKPGNQAIRQSEC